MAVRAGRVTLDGVYGKVYTRGKGPDPVLTEEKVVFTSDWRVRWTVGGQLAATLLDVTVVDPAVLGMGPAAQEAASA
ncbi:hypothetical protein [Streptomyces adelaidensis]|uniref:hypothetical protein n=1 Tax=Streptomyces adelaidensis TaxID=2796465 RepID=UPI00190729F2|nr:hypothetical protein [Streptomyces adelaidensis]